jgi:hypothetical protein
MLDQIAQTNYPNSMNFNRQMPIQKKSKIKSILKDFASVFTGNGVITGYIPPMSSYDDIYYNDSLRNNYNGFHNAPKYTPNYVYPYGYDSHYPNYNIQYDRNGLPKISNRDLYSRSAVKILRD